MTVSVFIPRDSSAVSLGADTVANSTRAEAARRGLDVKIVRNGSRGMFSHEPMVEVATSSGRIAYGPVTTADVASLFDSDFLSGRDHRLCVGIADDIPWLKSQTRLTFARVGVIDPVSLDFLKGAEIDFVDEMIGAAFKVKNPNATSSCGCGTSFSV